jgi:capsular exopolysaccharide synthesis family protein
MSQIFDALNQSTTERTGNGSREFSAAKELLQVVERKAVSPALLEELSPAPVSRDTPRQFSMVKAVLPEHSKFVCFGDPKSLAAEKFRFLATRLRHLQQKRSLRSLVVTSSVAGEGKSMVAANLASALAGGKQRVLLVEGDIRRPSLARQLGLEELPGLSQVLRFGEDSLNHIYSLEDSGLCVLLAGEAHSNPLEFMDSAKLSVLMDRITPGFDWVVIDSPPVLPLADTSIWARLADAILLVTRPGVTSKQQLQRTFEAIEQSKLLGSILNASTETTTNHYYYHYTPRPNAVAALSATAK